MKQSIKHYIGVDVGKTGGIVVLSSLGTIVSFHKIPLIGKEIDSNELSNIFDHIVDTAIVSNVVPHVCIEKVHALYQVSATSTFNFGYCAGLIDGIVRAKKISHTKIQPKDWQKIVWQTDEIEREPDTISKNGRKIAGKVKTKLVSLKAMKRLYPMADLRTSTRQKNQPDGLVDALLIAEACRRLNH